MTLSTSCGSGVPNVGAPDCMDIELENVPKMTGAPERTSWANAMPDRASAKSWAQVAAMVTGGGPRLQIWLNCKDRRRSGRLVWFLEFVE